MRRRRRGPVATVAAFVPIEGSPAVQWAAWEAWEASVRAQELPDDVIEEIVGASIPVMPDAPFDPDEI